MLKVGILGATGYTGQELVRLLQNHPLVKIEYLGTSSQAGRKYSEICPYLHGGADWLLEPENEVPTLDILFCALPHGLIAGRARELLQRGIKLIDLGADFRFRSAAAYQTWYKLEHPAPDLLSQAVYGLPELYREEIRGKSLIANPGCYPTAALLPLVPLLKAGVLETDSIIVDAKSGVSGAGRGLSLNTHFSECNENFKAYGVAEHRHTPEIEQQLSIAAGKDVLISFTPHLVPMTRGMLATIYAQVCTGVEEGDLRHIWEEQYNDEYFVKLLPQGVWPQTKYSLGNNRAFLQLTYDKRTGRAVLVAVIDNLVKGASGQAVQNMNLLMGFPEYTGLTGTVMWP